MNRVNASVHERLSFLGMVKLLTWAVLVVIGLYLAVALTLFVFQRRLIYPADPARHSPIEAGLDTVREVTLDTPDGEKLVAWYAPPQPGRPTLLYFHGNGGTLFIRADRIRRFLADGLGVFMPAYRGYSGSTGSPSEAALIADARLAYDHLITMGLRAEQIVVYGESLGTGVAVQLAASRQTAAVVLDAPFSSVTDIARRQYGFIPVKLFLLDTFASIDYIADIKVPLLIMHGTQDRIIPLDSSKALFEAAKQPKERVVLTGAGHSDIYSFGAMPVLRRFIDTHVPQPAIARP
jgi:fermentation-respiration switch protein FrsA (DUF1100 family)